MRYSLKFLILSISFTSFFVWLNVLPKKLDIKETLDETKLDLNKNYSFYSRSWLVNGMPFTYRAFVDKSILPKRINFIYGHKFIEIIDFDDPRLQPYLKDVWYPTGFLGNITIFIAILFLLSWKWSSKIDPPGKVVPDSINHKPHRLYIDM